MNGHAIMGGSTWGESIDGELRLLLAIIQQAQRDAAGVRSRKNRIHAPDPAVQREAAAFLAEWQLQPGG